MESFGNREEGGEEREGREIGKYGAAAVPAGAPISSEIHAISERSTYPKLTEKRGKSELPEEKVSCLT